MDQRSFLKHFLPNEGALKAYLLVATRNGVEAEDLLQEVAAVLWEKFGQYDPSMPFRPWALGVTRMEVLKWRQRKARSREMLSDEAIEVMAEEADRSAEDEAERRSLLRTCMDKLTEHTRAIVRRRYLDSLPIAEVARREGQSEGSVEMMLVRARRTLRECVDRRLGAGC